MANGTSNLYSQFVIQDIVQSPCDPRFYALLNQSVKIKRPYDTSDGVANVNEFGEVIMKASQAGEAVLVATVNARIVAKKGEGMRTEFRGKFVDADLKVFTCPEIDVQENDRLEIGGKDLLILRVDYIYRYSRLHHKEILCKLISYL